MEQFARWAATITPPTLFWLSGFTFPNGFLTAVLQSYARQHNVSHSSHFLSPTSASCVLLFSAVSLQISVDSLSWEFIVATVDDSNLVEPPPVGPLSP